MSKSFKLYFPLGARCDKSGISFENSSKYFHHGRSYPASCAIAGICKIRFDEAARAISSFIAFLTDSGVIIFLAVMLFLTRFIICFPA